MGRRLPAQRAWSRRKPVCEVGVHSQGFADPQFLHHHEAQAVHKTIRLILMPSEIGEGGSFFLRAGPMDARQPLRVELLADSRGLGMAYLECQRDRFGHDVIGRQEVVN